MLNATPLLRLHAHRRLRHYGRDPVQAQRSVLRHLLQRARATRFGLAHGFADIDDPATYQRRVAPRDFETFFRDWLQPSFPTLRDLCWPGLIPYFALSSGTSGAPSKYIPVSAEMMRSNRRAALDVLAFHVAAHPGSRVLAGQSCLLGGTAMLETLAPGVQAGDLSGIAAATVPAWARRRVWPPPAIARMGDWDGKLAALAGLMPDQRVTSLSGTPSWMLPLFARLAASRPDRARRLAALLPSLELIIHGGVGFAPYAAAFAPWLAGSAIALREVYAASEGFIGIADRGAGEGLRLLTDNGLFYEFIRPADLDTPRPARAWLADAEIGPEYALAITSNAGLWSVVIGDTVRLVSRDPPRLLITGRLSAMLSAFGEHLIAAELDQAMAEGAQAAGLALVDYTATARFPAPDRPLGCHVFIAEFTTPPDEAARIAFLAAADATLRRLNDDYAAHRQALAPPELRVLQPGAFAAWMRARGKLGGQNKVPRVLRDEMQIQALCRHAAD